MTTLTKEQLAIVVLQTWRMSASYDSFVVNQNILLRLKFGAENRYDQQAPKR